jgi:signal transduction histidine kinase
MSPEQVAAPETIPSIENHDSVTSSLRGALEADGYEVERAPSLPEALATTGSVQFDATVVHVRAPRSARAVIDDLGALNAQIEQLTAERDEARLLAEERGVRLGQIDRISAEFLATAAHDLKGPLTAIKGHSELLLRRISRSPPDMEQLAHGLSVIDAQTTAMARLLDDLLDASRIQAGALVPRTAPCALGECFTTVLARLTPDERVCVELALPDAPLAGDWEQKRIEQVLANLIGNALKYSPESARVTVAVQQRPGEIEVAVADQGMGISAEELPRLFERFHRTRQAQASGLPGTGLGLYICRGIIEIHEGRIWSESAGVGQGSTFRFNVADRTPDGGWAERWASIETRRQCLTSSPPALRPTC